MRCPATPYRTGFSPCLRGNSPVENLGRRLPSGGGMYRVVTKNRLRYAAVWEKKRERLLTCKPLAAASRGGSIGGPGGGKGGNGGSNGNSGPGNGDQPPYGHLAWGSIFVGVLLGGSLCLNLVLMGWDPKSEGKDLKAPIVGEEVIFSASVNGEQKPKEIQGKPESLSYSQSNMGSLAIVLLLIGAIVLGKRRGSKKSSDEATQTLPVVMSAVQRGRLPPAPTVELEHEPVQEEFNHAQSSPVVTVERDTNLQSLVPNITVNAAQPTPMMLPVPICIPIPIPLSIPAPSVPQEPAKTSPFVLSMPSIIHSPPQPSPHSPSPEVQEQSVRKRSKEEDLEDLVQEEDEGAWERLLDYKTPNIRTEYIFKELIGRGSTSMVRKVVKLSSNEEFACKSISKQNLRSKKDVEDMKREIKVMWHIAGCEHIVQLHDVYEDKKSVHLVMDLCRGGELFDTIVAAGSYSEKDAANIIRVILKVISHCHGLKVVHRDIKPENFMWADAESTQLKAIDFGLSAFWKNLPFKDLVGSKYTIAPEVLYRSYNYKVDIWSCGVIMYWLLSGFPPFLGDTLHEVFDNIRGGNIDYPSEHWQYISDGAKSCLSKMLAYRSRARSEADELLQHKWINEAPDAPMDTSVTSRFKAFGGMNKLQQVTRKVIANNLPLDALEGLENMFKALDVDRDGTITLDEIRKELLNKKVSVSAEELESVLKSADLDGSGEINISEFLAATVNAVELAKEGNLLMAFETFDEDGSGYITHDELRSALKKHTSTSPEHIEQLLADIDQDRDGQISYEEFKAMMLSA